MHIPSRKKPEIFASVLITDSGVMEMKLSFPEIELHGQWWQKYDESISLQRKFHSNRSSSVYKDNASIGWDGLK